MPIQSLLIKPAGPDCNLSCRYCFYAATDAQFAPGAHRMSMQTLQRALRSYVPSATGGVHIGFQGGEPTLMGLPFFQEAHRLILALKNPAAQLNWALQTNGTLLGEEWAAFAAQTGLLLGVSLDGPPDVHNALRSGSHERVLAGIGHLRAAGAQFNTLTVVSQHNVARPLDVWDALLDAGSQFFQFIACLRDELSPNPFAWADFLMAAFERWEQSWPLIYVRNFDEMLISFAQYREVSCQTSPRCALNLVVEHDGSVYPCDFFVDDAHKLGNAAGDDLVALSDSPAAQAFVAAKAPVDPRCAACAYRPLCQGHCPAYRGADGSAVLCEGLQRFYAFAQPRLLAMKRRLIAQGRIRDPLASADRNILCPCGSGRKFKTCCLPLKR